MLGTRTHWVRLLVTTVLATLGVWPAAAEEAPTAKPPTDSEASTGPRRPRPGDVQKVFIIQHASTQALADILKVFPATITHARGLPRPAIGVSAAPAVVAAIEETIKRLDVPSGGEDEGKSVEITGYVLEALSETGGPSRMPPDLEPTITQLKRTFGYADYRLVDTLVARSAGESGVSANALGAAEGGAGARRSYSLEVNRVTVVPGESGPIVRLRNVEFLADIPLPAFDPLGIAPQIRSYTNKRVGIKANIDIRPGQKVVVGKSGVADPTKAMILVLSAKVEE